MANSKILRPFSGDFLSQFVWAPGALPFKDKEIVLMDQELAVYEQAWLNPEIERNLISKNELLASFAISKAETSQLTLAEAQKLYQLREFELKGKLTQKDHDKLEFFNIARTFRSLNREPVEITSLEANDLLTVHRQLTQGLDVFNQYLLGFTGYKSGSFRRSDDVRVGSYVPAPYREIKAGVKELISWLKYNQTITGVAVFHTALYALHPFHNGNKRVCRIIEHVWLRSLGLNRKNLYSSSYYYHRQKDRYYKYLLYSLERKNLNYFVAFIQEALVLSIVDVVKTTLAMKRKAHLAKFELANNMRLVLKPFIRRGELQFKQLVRFTRGKVAKQTLVNYLAAAVRQGILAKREAGRVTFYRLRYEAPEAEMLNQWLTLARTRLNYIPD